MGFGKKAASNKGGDFERLPAGAHAAVLVAIVQIGTQTESYGSETWEAEKVYFVWEVPSEKKQDGTSHVVGECYTDSLNKKAKLRIMLEGWRGKQFDEGEEFDYLACLGKPCLLQITHGKSAKGNEYASIGSIGQLPKGTPAPVATYEPFSWPIEDDPSKLPDWLPYIIGKSVPDKIAASAEKQGRKSPSANGTPAAAEAPVAPDSIPF